MTAPTILLVEDDPALRTLTARTLTENGFLVRSAGAAPEMWLTLDAGPVDLILLDIMLPGTSGIDLCRAIRRTSDVPIIFISAKGSETDRVVGLELGADDYLAKPFGPRELVARIRAVLRRPPLDRRDGADAGTLRFDGWTLSLPRRELLSPGGAAVELTGAEFDLLAVLCDHAGRVIARERLIELSRARLGDSSDRSVDVLVSRLRRKLGTAGKPAPIITVRGVGYMLNVSVERGWKRFVRPSLGLLGRLVAILLLTTLIEFGVSTLLYERASQFSVRDDEARRLAEHLVISRRLVAERPPPERALMAADLSTDRYALRWQTALPPPPPVAPSLDSMRRQVVTWEPALAAADLRLRLTSPGRSSVVAGGLRLPDGTWLYFQTLAPVGGLNLTTERVLLALIPAVALMLLGGTAIRRALLPLRRLALAADRVGSGVPERVPEQGPGDVVRVVTAFNRMGARIHRLLADRTEALAAVGHDLRTPLARLRLRAGGVADPDTRRAIEGDVAEMEAMIGSLMAYLGGEGDPEPPVRTDVAVLLATLIDHAVDAGREAEYIGPDHLEATVRASGLKRAVGNLLDNALRHGDTVQVTLVERADALVIRVEDDGPGIPEPDLLRVTEPFVRLDAARGRDTGGFGLGLAIVRRLVEGEGGSLALGNRPEGGLRAELVLPRL